LTDAIKERIKGEKKPKLFIDSEQLENNIPRCNYKSIPEDILNALVMSTFRIIY
jgi:hypothetical protein